jgi:hypothetical protein
MGFATDVTRGSPFSPLVSFASQRASGTRVNQTLHGIIIIFIPYVSLIAAKRPYPCYLSS